MMIIGKDDLSGVDRLEVVLRTGETYVVPVAAVTDIALELEPAKNEDKYSVVTGRLSLSAGADAKPAYEDGKKLFARLAAGCDVSGLDIVREDDSRLFTDVPCDPLTGLGGRVIEYSNCASLEKTDGGVTVHFGAESVSPRRSVNDFAGLIAGIAALVRLFGRAPTFGNCRVNGLKTFMHGRREMRIAAELGVKEYGGNRTPLALVFEKVKDLALDYERGDGLTELRITAIGGGRLHVIMPGFGVGFTCGGVSERAFYEAREKAKPRRGRKKPQA